MSHYSIDSFIQATAQDDAAADLFQLENPYTLEVNLNGRVWAKAGSMIGYLGGVTFTREGVLEHGVGTMLKRMVSGEGTSLMKMDGKGRVYLAEKGKKIRVLKLENETIHVNGNDLLAMEDGVKWNITMMRKVAGMLAGGLFNVRLQGPGFVAITTHYEPLTLRVTPDQPLFTDPNATVAWSGSLSPDVVTNVTFRTLIGRGSGEAIQLKFAGDGWVVLQPYEEVYLQANQG
ncbi:AIM24 family protein [Chloroflexia bacterium SDU3-3]|nr:AIM24 family protein [Chloroflexia bacterium SDU3-3]